MEILFLLGILPFIVYVVIVFLLRKYLSSRVKRRLGLWSPILNLASLAFILIYYILVFLDWYLPFPWVILAIFICMISGLCFYISDSGVQTQGRSYLGYPIPELIRWLYGGFYFWLMGIMILCMFVLMLGVMGCSVSVPNYDDDNFKVSHGAIYRKYGFIKQKVADLPPSVSMKPVRKVTAFGNFVRLDFDTSYLYKEGLIKEDSMIVVRIH